MTKLKAVRIEDVRPWVNTERESNMVEVSVDGAIIGYVWKKVRRFPLTSGMIKIGVTDKTVYAYSLGTSSTPSGYKRTRTLAVAELVYMAANN